MGHAAGPKPIGVAITRAGLTPRLRLGRPRVKWLEPGARPAQHPGLATKHQVSTAPVGVPPAWRLEPTGCSLIILPTKQCSP